MNVQGFQPTFYTCILFNSDSYNVILKIGSFVKLYYQFITTPVKIVYYAYLNLSVFIKINYFLYIIIKKINMFSLLLCYFVTLMYYVYFIIHISLILPFRKKMWNLSFFFIFCSFEKLRSPFMNDTLTQKGK